MKKKSKIIVGVCALGLVLAGGIGGGLYFSGDREVNAMLDEPWVEQVSNMTFSEDFSNSAFSGKVEPEKHEKIYYEPDKGTIKEVFVQEGELIEEGTELFIYEPLDDSTLELEQLKMQLDMSYLQINQSDKKKKKIEKSLKEAQDEEEKELIQEELDQLQFDLRMSNLEAGQLQKQIAGLEEEAGSTAVVSKSTGIVQSVNQDVVDGASLEQAPGAFIQIVSTGSYLIKSQINEFLLDSIEVDQEVNGMDVIFGGHSHDTIETPIKYTYGYVTQANEYGKALGHTNLIFHNDNLIGVNGFLYRDHADKAEDPSVTAILDEYKEAVDEELNEVIATTPVQLDGERTDVRTKETNLGNLITDAMRTKLGTEIAVTNGGGIRASIQPGEVTRNDVLTTLPFDNTLVRTTLTGDEILAALEHSVRLYPAENGGFLHVSGLNFSFDPAQPAGNRVGEVLVNGEPLEYERPYSVATNNFTAAGGDGFEMFNVDKIEFDSGELLSTILINALQSGQPITGVENRIVVK